MLCFNTQPPEGGWLERNTAINRTMTFQHTATRRRLVFHFSPLHRQHKVSTHSRPKAAGHQLPPIVILVNVSTHSRPKAAGSYLAFKARNYGVSTHSRPKAAGAPPDFPRAALRVSTHSRPKAAGSRDKLVPITNYVSTHSRPKAAGAQPDFPRLLYGFQHTAARRRLDVCGLGHAPSVLFQHTAARRRLVRPPFGSTADKSFNTQPPEGGWSLS